MVAPAPNWSDIRGKVVAVQPATSPPGFLTVEIEVRDSRVVEGFHHFFGDATGRILPVRMPEELVRRLGLSAGREVACRVRRGRSAAEVHVDPDRVTVD
jgi:hypothetical protein